MNEIVCSIRCSICGFRNVFPETESCLVSTESPDNCSGCSQPLVGPKTMVAFRRLSRKVRRRPLHNVELLFSYELIAHAPRP